MAKGKKDGASDPADVGGFVDEVKGAVMDRLNHPFFGWYLTSFLLWNWPAVVTLWASTAPIDTRIQDVQRMLYGTEAESHIAWNFGWPFAFALLAAPFGRALSAVTIWGLGIANKAWEKAVESKFSADAKLRTVEEQMGQLRAEANKVGKLSRQIRSLEEQSSKLRSALGLSDKGLHEAGRRIKELEAALKAQESTILANEKRASDKQLTLSEQLGRTQVCLVTIHDVALPLREMLPIGVEPRAKFDRLLESHQFKPVLEEAQTIMSLRGRYGLPTEFK